MALLLVRGVLLWAVVPAAFCVWMIVSLRPGRRRVGVGRFVGWVDLNLIAFLERGVLRPLFPTRAEWVGWSGMATVTHRVRLLDPA
jgi:hypothetical protein